jgi:hypothetical protein
MPQEGMTRLEELEHRQLTDGETQQLRQQAREAIRDDPDVVKWTEEDFHLPTSTIRSLLFRFEFEYAEELACGTRVLEFVETIHLDRGDLDGEEGTLTVRVETVPHSDDVETVLVATRA